MCDFLPESIHDVLNDVETSLSLPVLLVIVLCTAQFIVTHSMRIACTVREILQKRAERKKRQKKCPPKPGPSLVQRLKKWCAAMGGSKKAGCSAAPSCKKKKRPSCKSKCAAVSELLGQPNEDDWADDPDDLDEEDEDIDDAEY